MVSDPAREAFYAGLPRKRIGAGALITDELGRVLLVEPTYKPTWEVPGGAVEDHETAVDACRRECTEELGRQVAVGRLLVVDHQVDRTLGDSIGFIYDGGSFGPADGIRLPADELRSYRYVPVDDLGSLTAPRLARRLQHAIKARADGRLAELVNGEPAHTDE